KRQASTRTRAVPGTVSVSAYSAAARKRGAARTSAMAIAVRDDRISLALLLAPFLIVALSLGGERAVRQFMSRAPQFIAAAQPPVSRPPPMRSATPMVPAALQDPQTPQLPSLALLELLPPVLPSLALLELPPP